MAQMLLPILPDNLVSAAQPAPKSQQIKKVVETEPGGWDGIVYWYQEDDGMFKADFPDGTHPRVANGGTASQPFPVAYRKAFTFPDIDGWAVASWKDVQPAQVSQIKNIKIKEAVWEDSTPDITTHGNPVIVSDKEVWVDVTSGGKVPSESKNYERFGTQPNGNPKYLVGYLVPLRLIWQGELYQEKEIDVNPNSSLQVGKTLQLNASVKTKDFGSTSWSDWVHVEAHPETKWESENESIAVVSATGVVTAKAVGTVNIRATWKSGAYEISDIATITVTAGVPTDPCKTNPNAPGCTPPTYTVTGDFDILPSSTINWRDSFQLKPKNFNIPVACKYLYHEYRIIKDGIIWQSSKITSQTTITSFNYSTYPYSLGIGANLITIRVTADCADSGWTADKYLQINSPNANRPPEFTAGFFKEYNRTGINPDYEVVVGSRVNLRIINDPTKNPPLPHDPDGDPISYRWLFSDSSSAWIRSLPSEYGFGDNYEAYFNIVASELGYHNIRVIARDPFGAESIRTVSINVIPENPIPLIDGPTEVKENRPLPQPFSGSRSYSPAGYQIVDYLWENKKEKYTTPGTEIIKLDVVDSKGLKSLAPAQHTLIVLPDDPPIGVLEVPPLGIRGESFQIFNKSYSPDGDKIASLIYRYKYDADNNGFADDAWQNIQGQEDRLDFEPDKVGKYLFDIYVCEDYGKCAYASDTQAESSRILDVVNQAPAVSFIIEGKNEEPLPPDRNVIAAETILNTWALYDVNTNTQLAKKPHMWTTDNGKLLAGLGRGMEKQYAFTKSMHYQGTNEIYRLFTMLSDNGFGPNGISAYRGLDVRDPAKSGPVLIPIKTFSGTYTTGEDYDRLDPAKNVNLVRSNQQYIYFDQTRHEYYKENYYADNIYLFALNKNKIPRQRSEDEVIVNGNSYNLRLKYIWDDPNPYDFILKIPYYGDGPLPYYNYNDVLKPGWREKADAGDYSGASSIVDLKGTSLNLKGIEVSGSRIYAVYSGNKLNYAYYDSNSRSPVKKSA